MGGLRAHLPTLCRVSAVLGQKWRARPPVLHPSYSPNLTLSNSLLLLFPWMKKVLKGECFAHVEEVKQKLAKAPKCLKTDK